MEGMSISILNNIIDRNPNKVCQFAEMYGASGKCTDNCPFPSCKCNDVRMASASFSLRRNDDAK